MKKIVWTFFSIVLFLSGISHIEAKTIIEPTSDNGNVKINLSFEEGYVGGIDATFKINGQVSLTGVNWNSAITNNYTKRYSYDEKSGTIRLIVTTGNQKNNLLDKKGNVSLGSLSFKSKTSSKATYTVELVSLTMVDATYQSIVKNDLELKGNNQFVVSGSSSTGGNTENNNPPTTNPSENDNTTPSKPNSSNNTTNNSTVTTKPLVPSVGNKNQPTEDKTDENDEKDDEKQEENFNKEDNSKDKLDSDKEKPTSNGSKKEDNKKEPSEVKKDNKKFPFRVVGIALIVVALLAFIGRKLKH